MLGRTGSLELEQTVWKSVPSAFRRLVTGLRKEEKVVLTPSARQPMIIRSNKMLEKRPGLSRSLV